MTKPTLLQPSRKRGTFVMLCGSLLFHSALVGTAALWPKANPSPTPEIIISELEPLGGELDPAPPNDLVSSEPPPLLPAAPPEPAPPSVEDEPPLVEDQEVTEPVPPKPKPPLPQQKPKTPPQPTTASAASRLTTGISSARTGSGTTGRQGSGIGTQGSGAAGWHIPKPAYTFAIRSQQLQGVARVRVTTGPAGRISEVVLVRSSGSRALDDNTLSSVRANWSGPPNASTEREVEYRLQ